MERRMSYVYRLYPSRIQEREMDRILTTCRYFYNDLLAERKDAWEQRQETVGKTAQLRHVRKRKASNPHAAPVHSHILQVVVADLDRAFQAFFRRVKAGEEPGYPRFRGANRWRSFGLKELGNGFSIDGRRLKVHGVGRMAVRWHRPIEGAIKTVRLSKKAGHWYAAFSCVVDAPAPLAQTGKSVGVDVGLSHLVTLSDGERIVNPRWYRASQSKLRVIQRRIARRTKGGANRRKAIAQVQRQHERVARQRKDCLDKVAWGLISRYDLIALEKLRVANMVKNHSLSKSILDAGWTYFAQHLTSKAASAGREVRFVDPAYTSKTCSGCGVLFNHDITLSTRWITCSSCGLSLDRDHNAALNILKRAGTPPLGANVAGLPACVAQEAAGF